MTEHLGYDKHDPVATAPTPATAPDQDGVYRDRACGHRRARDRDVTFEPAIDRKRQRRLDGLDEMVLSLSARGLTSGEIAAHFTEVYGTKVSRHHPAGSPTRSSRR